MISIVHSLKLLLGGPPNLPIIGGDVFVLGSAPDPVIPTDMLTHATIFSVNGSQATLDKYGVECPHFTFMRANMWRKHEVDRATLDVLRGRRTENLIIVAQQSGKTQVQFDRQTQCLSDIGYEFNNVHFLRKPDRYLIVGGKKTGLKSKLVSRSGASMGICAIMSGLYMGANSVTFAGLSFRTMGHSYNGLDHHRHHLDEDAKVLERAQQRGNAIFTCDSSFAEDSGTALYNT